MAGAATLAFLIALEIAARRYGLPGPMTNQAKELVFAPASGPLLYAGLALTMVVLTWRQRFVAMAAAVGVDLVVALVRWTADDSVTGSHSFGNGALWAILGCAAVAVTRRTGRERILLLKGVGLGLLLVAGRKTGDAWLLITSKTRPDVLDPYVATADHALGNPSWLMGRLVRATGPVGEHLLDWVYAQLAVAAVVVALYQLRRVADERRFPRHHLVRTFLVIGLLGPAVYMVFPVVGPVFAYGTGAFGTGGEQWAIANLWPDTLPPVAAPQPFTYDGVTPRNCMPSLHTAWATVIFIHSRRAPRVLRFAGTFWLVATLTATLGFGYHYAIDLLAGAVFAVTVEAALRAFDRGWDRSGTGLVAHGVVVFAAILTATRYLAPEMARHPWVFGPLLVLAAASVLHAYARTTKSWAPLPAVPAQRAEPRLESAPEAPEAPEAVEAVEAPEAPEAPGAPLVLGPRSGAVGEEA
ncbi:phosphatase PAP2 family protein [Streptomyces sp. NPDC044948]|uniref:phosphatase PAP2 family protein n=1 Tax=Streptomyces sp. NPDC044948 TaxID=3157092 RepID=UPI0033E2B2B7